MTIPPAAARGPARGAITTILAGAAATLLAFATAMPCVADPSPAPAPEDALTGIESVALAVAEERSPAAVPLPLTGSPKTDRPTAVGRSPLQPLGDWTVLLAIAAAFALVAAFRFTSLRRTRSLPPDVFELLGEATLGGQQTARVVRFGPRTLLIGVSSAGCQTLAELDDPQATERIVLACRGEPAAARAIVRDPRPRPAAKPAGGEAA